MTDYSELSDFEINKRVRLAIGKSISYTDKGRVLILCTNKVYRVFDPCNNPADAWPLILGNKITISPCSDDSLDEWCASAWVSGEWGTVDIWHENPLRAACIVYLMMKEAE